MTEHEPFVSQELQKVLTAHPLLALARVLGKFLGTGCDLIVFLVFVSRAAACLGWPINLAIGSSSPSIDHLLVSRIEQLVPGNITQVCTIREMHQLAKRGFDGAQFVNIRSESNHVFRLACETTSQCASEGSSVPAIYWIGDHLPDSVSWGPTLPLVTDSMTRSLKGVGRLYAEQQGPARTAEESELKTLFQSLGPMSAPACDFQERIRGHLRPEEMLLTNRTMNTIAVLRTTFTQIGSTDNAPPKSACTFLDYSATRSLLTALPVWSSSDNLSAQALETALDLYSHTVKNSKYEQTVEDLSGIGRKAFDRRIAQKLLKKSYNAVKSHIAELENIGIVESSVQPAFRGRGRKIWFRFAKGYQPRSLTVANPYDLLPPVETIAEDCI